MRRSRKHTQNLAGKIGLDPNSAVILLPKRTAIGDQPIFRKLAGQGICVINCGLYLNLWYVRAQRTGISFLYVIFITTSILFSQLRKSESDKFFIVFSDVSSRTALQGCYIGFSGFSTPGVGSAQLPFLNTTYVTADTTGAFKRRSSRESFHGSDI